ncbi:MULTISPECIES: class I SAM-dependent methyltransferase [unclassified Streptococcus]|uniref:class I SAM-dependent methyltransferase n=1 Tax=unclassified Streptococcus TaxID=2608887 RepID=UPI0018AC35C6|nr:MULTISPECIES: class I SAM-dependent methyltransferase [unclassified Streptococcus]MBF8969764.1 class I SAM-dependent methyltransferase [Streptococcus sp. NLN76]MBG9367567.1 class I SAM-dependent methyltransferase [Streptococcus sp. NLN64]MBJ6745894.1 class I SAM-dependent methyltransferase [Streptococcus sp. 121]
MNFEKIEQAFGLLLENVQTIQNQLKTGFYEAVIEQNANYLQPHGELKSLAENNQKVAQLGLTPEEWRRTFQYLMMKGQQTEPLQPNHQATPDSLGFLMTLVIDHLFPQDSLRVLELGSGMGNLAETILLNSQKEMDYLGVELDDILVELSASIAEVLGTEGLTFSQGDAVRSQVLQKNLVVSDLPIGYYPDDAIASRFQVASSEGHTYAHHLLMEQGVKYLDSDGYAIFLAPTQLLTSPQSGLLKGWIQSSTELVALVNLPEKMFANPHYAKSLFIFRKPSGKVVAPFIYAFSDLSNPEEIRDFQEKMEMELK